LENNGEFFGAEDIKEGRILENILKFKEFGALGGKISFE